MACVNLNALVEGLVRVHLPVAVNILHDQDSVPFRTLAAVEPVINHITRPLWSMSMSMLLKLTMSGSEDDRVTCKPAPVSKSSLALHETRTAVDKKTLQGKKSVDLNA